MGLGVLDRLIDTSPVMETVRFLVQERVNDLPAESVQDQATSFANTQRGSDLANMSEGFIPTSPSDYAAAVSVPIAPALQSTPTRRRTRLPAPPAPRTLRHSTRLARKARSRTPTVVAAQNVLLKKLNITTDGPPVAVDIEAYINEFQQGLTVEQSRLIMELFAAHLPEPSVEVAEEATA